MVINRNDEVTETSHEHETEDEAPPTDSSPFTSLSSKSTMATAISLPKQDEEEWTSTKKESTSTNVNSETEGEKGIEISAEVHIPSNERQNSTTSTAPLLSGSPPATSDTDGPSTKESQSTNGPLRVMEKLEEEEGVSAKPTNQIESNSEDGEKLLVSDTRPTDNEN
ncbi:PREDICTED: uncharacterized protein LOC100632319 [Amphimedon queenslandica]|uniref:Uncharacterized protein n=1 Tax=Amphimedon queenslandica TaxID=400682 RepID=A0AAN0K550_AMPQE|nr:PREDICTED: uncharacterized protein LOC100632319 [Amphimedon queenslandica]|eukprot:XP_019864436.1 PREDICTED: uncharacterized protein LOC100632319 [Amphimedon queenslandica]